MSSEPGDRTMKSGATGAPESGGQAPGTISDQPIALEPTDAEIAEWAERERKRREAWLSGPTAEERAAFARRERERRLADVAGERDANAAERDRMVRRYGRETQLAAEGAINLVWTWSRRSFAELVRAGRDWEQESGPSTRGRRVPMDDEAP
jgi:hypothetical protein